MSGIGPKNNRGFFKWYFLILLIHLAKKTEINRSNKDKTCIIPNTSILRKIIPEIILKINRRDLNNSIIYIL
jgi:hypothetical protein